MSKHQLIKLVKKILKLKIPLPQDISLCIVDSRGQLLLVVMFS